ncbi:hypothetical protein [Xanthomarina gelatinilytica]|uniref:hypothetical protein n=1 Tax=Xanthomarina gelatinilytica TaxID=1137281 RepID=UPI003AA7EA5B
MNNSKKNQKHPMSHNRSLNNTLKMIALALIATLTFSCSKDDDAPSVEAPTLAYSTNIEATFFTAGSSAAPTINWNGEQGTFSLTSAPINGLTVNENTGVLSYAKILPPGEHNLEVTATNSTGSNSTTVTVKNTFQGTFSGLYDGEVDGEIGSPFYDIEMEFHPNGSITGAFIGGSISFNGNWELMEDKVYIEFDSDGSGGQYSILDEIVITDESVNIGTTTLYDGYGAEPGQERGDISLCLGDC